MTNQIKPIITQGVTADWWYGSIPIVQRFSSIPVRLSSTTRNKAAAAENFVVSLMRQIQQPVSVAALKYISSDEFIELDFLISIAVYRTLYGSYTV